MTLLNSANKIMLGGMEVDKLYLGSAQVYAKASSPPPTANPPVYQAMSAGAVVSGNAFGNGTMVVTPPANSVTGEIILVEIGLAFGTNVPVPVLPGYQLLLDVRQVNGTSSAHIIVFYKVAGANEGAATFNVGARGSANMSYICRRISNCQVPVLASGLGYTGAGVFTMTAPAMTTSVPGSIVHSLMGGRGPTGGTVGSNWSGGATELYEHPTGNVSFIGDAAEVLSQPGTTQHACEINNTQGAPSSVIGSLVLRPAA